MTDRYQLLDENLIAFTIERASLKIMDDSFFIEINEIERAAIDGAVIIGKPRSISKELPMVVDIYSEDEQSFRSDVNNLMFYLRKAHYILDRRNQHVTEVRYTEGSLQYPEGAFYHIAKLNFTFKQLSPFWEDILFSEETFNSSVSNEIVINNHGFYDTPPIIILEAAVNIPKLLVKEQNTGYGIGINELNFGKTNLTIMVINCKTGQVYLGDDEDEGIARNNRILPGTGFFFLRRGINNIIVTTWNDLAIDAKIKYKGRYFV